MKNIYFLSREVREKTITVLFSNKDVREKKQLLAIMSSIF